MSFTDVLHRKMLTSFLAWAYLTYVRSLLEYNLAHKLLTYTC